MIDFYSDVSGHCPLILLHDDIQLEDYEAFYEVVWGEQAEDTLEAHCDARTLAEGPVARLACIDLFPALFPEPEWMLATFSRFLAPGDDLLREISASGAFARIFVQVWAPSDCVHTILDSFGAVNLHTGEPAPAPDPLLLEAAKMIESVSYNGLSRSRSKETAIRLLRALKDEGYPIEKEPWLQAHFAAGGEARHAETLAKYISEMKQGVSHRVKQQKNDHLLEVLYKRAAHDAH